MNHHPDHHCTHRTRRTNRSADDGTGATNTSVDNRGDNGVDYRVDTPTARLPRAVRQHPNEHHDEQTGSPSVSMPSTPVSMPLSVWATAQTSPAAQRKNKYVAESTAHPAKMLPAVAAHAITHYTRPGELVLDPMCGIGTTLVEALHLGRRAVGVEYEPHWAQVTSANLDLARQAGVDHGPEHGVEVDGLVVRGDARQLTALLPPELRGQAALVVTSPPYGPSTHGQVTVAPDAGVHKYHHLYGNTLDRGNLANIGHHRLLSGFTKILTHCARFLRPGGHVVITIRPWREHAELIDLPSQILACGIHAGLIPVERCVALLARVGEHDLVPRGSFFQRDFIRKQRDAGLPLHLIAHEDVAVFRTPLFRQSSAIAKTLQDSGDLSAGRARRAGNTRGSSAVESRAA